MKEKRYYVYKHTSPSNKIYIGITCKNPEIRWRKDGSGYRKQMFWDAIQKYGWNNFQHEILAENLTKEEAENMEIELIAKHKSNNPDFGYNIHNGGNSSGTHSEETKQKISNSLKGNKLSEETKDKIRQKAIGRPSSCRGAHLSDEHKQKLREKAIGRKPSAETKQKMSENHADFSGGKSPNAIKIHCDNIIFCCIKECSVYYNVKYVTIKAWLKGTNNMPKQFKELGLRYATEEDVKSCLTYNKEIHGEVKIIELENVYLRKTYPNARKIFCNNMIFLYIKDFCEFYDKKPSNVCRWLNGTRKMPQEFIDLGLRYAIEEDVLKYPIYNENIK